jgi:sporulation protein YlmC with PRC-barrel domain
VKNSEVNLELLLGRRVIGVSGKPIGRLEEIVAEVQKGECLIEEFHVGAYAVFERLSAWSIGRAVLQLFHLGKGGYRIPWGKLDLTDPEMPRLRCAVSELSRLKA